MISLDKKILDPNSTVAQRMIQQGLQDSLFIVVPAVSTQQVRLSTTVQVLGVGGSKFFQFFGIISSGRKFLFEHPEITVVTCQDPFFTALAAFFIWKQPLVFEVQVHGDFFGSNYYRAGSLMNRARYYLGKFFIRLANPVRVAGERIKQSIIATGVAEHRIVARPVTLDPEATPHFKPHFNLHERFPGYEKIFVALGRLDPVKNIAWLIQLFPELLKTHRGTLLVIVGDGVERAALELLVKHFCLRDNIVFTGWVNDPLSYLASSDGLLFPSLSEGYGLALLEANAVGCPIVTTDVGVANFELNTGPAVHIVPINDRAAFLKAVFTLYN